MEVTSEDMEKVYDRLRETETQTREQNVRIQGLCDRVASFTVVTDKFFEKIDKEREEGKRQFDVLMAHFKEHDERSEKREIRFWKIIAILGGTVIALALGKDMAKELAAQWLGKTPITAVAEPFVLPGNDHDLIV